MIRSLRNIAIAGVMTSVLLITQSVQALQLSFSSISQATISFDGNGNFTFLPTLANQFRIGGSDGTGDSIGDMGRMDGTWSFGPVSSPSPGEFQAPVTGTGTLVIHDGVTDLTGSLTWNLIETKGTSGVLNFKGVLNLSGLTYSGSQADLQQLATLQGGNAQENVEFSTTTLTGGQVTLADLVNGTELASAFSGKLVALPQSRIPDSGSSMLLLGTVLFCCETFRRKLA